MTRHRLEVADVFRTHGRAFLAKFDASLSVDQRRVLHAVSVCRTSELGGHVERCDQCGHERISYNSCRNRHCPKCQAMARAEWMEARAAELLPVPYFHVVFTLPKEIRPLALQNKRIVYDILFRSAAETLKELAADPKHLGAEIGILAVLHTWGQNLMHHPHVHCVVTGGGIVPDRAEWVHCKRSRRQSKVFFIPEKVLSRVFRGKFIDFLKRAFHSGKLGFFGKLTPLAKPAVFERWLNTAVQNDWVVDVKRPFGSAQVVLKYLARYTHRVAISNSRLVAMRDGNVHFRWKDYADGGKQKIMVLEATEFIRRFLLHVLPTGFMRIRHYGFLANRFRQEKLALCRQLLGVASEPTVNQEEADAKVAMESAEEAGDCCPRCGKGVMQTVHEVPPVACETATRAIVGCSRAPPS